MTPIHQLLSRIRWDRDFGRARFEIAFFDRQESSLHRVALAKIAFPKGERRMFEWQDETGQVRRIPFHRIREVYRDGQLVWQRPT